MEKKDTWIIVAVIAVIGVVFLGPSLTGKAWFQPVQAADIKANSCDRDSICETNGLEVTSNLGPLIEVKGPGSADLVLEATGISGHSWQLQSSDSGYLNIIRDSETILQFDDAGNIANQLTVSGSSGPQVEIVGSPSSQLILNAIGGGESWTFQSSNSGYLGLSRGSGGQSETAFQISPGVPQIKFNQLGGIGNAYACFKSDGTLYRSQTTCV